MKTQSHSSQLAQLLRSRVSSSATDDAISSFLHDLDTPRSLTVWLLYSLKEHDQLVSLDIDPLDYSDANRFRLDYIATHFLSKADFLDTSVSKKKAAMDKFYKFERQCGETNDRLRRNLPSPSLTNDEDCWLRNAVTSKIRLILEDFSPEEFVDSCNWGPGVTTLLKGSHVSAANKFQSETGITRDLYAFVKPWFAEAFPMCALHLWSLEADQSNDGFTFEKGNVIVTVPKNSKTDRVIAIEPGWNLWFQKGIGAMIRRRLARFGVDLNNQSKNQQFSHEGAFDGHLATIDFSSASDSISIETVREVLPYKWFQILDIVRSKVGVSSEGVVRWKKFSSMGNGFTFELESLIFFAAACVACDFCHISCSDISVFGDDVIIPVGAVDVFSRLCQTLGFTVNAQKSFSSGPFRESCGSHYFEALDCKPVYLKGKLQTFQSLFKLLNAVRLLAHRFGLNRFCDRRFLPTWRSLYKRVPKPLRLGIPRGFGDGGIIMNFDEARPSLAPRSNELTWEGYSIRMVLEIGVTQSFDAPGLLLDRVRGGSTVAYGNCYTLRGQVKTRVSRVFIPSWYNLGEWT
jgi:hypothetical protein